MKKKQHKLWLFMLTATAICSCNAPTQPTTSAYPDLVLVNQVGYALNMPKKALIRCNAPTFKVVTASGKEVFNGTTDAFRYWEYSGDSAAIADFSELTQVGTYMIVVNDTIVSYPFEISDTPYQEVGKAAIKGLYLNRTSMPIEAKYGGKWARPASHPDTAVYIHASAASKLRPEGTVVSSPLGWYDAGDFNKYVVNSGITTYTLLKALEDYPELYANQNLNIPESGNKLPDLLDETLFNLRWVITMQDPNDGGVYHKLTNKGFDPFVMPHEATEKRYLVMKTTAATLNYAALLAKAARTLQPYSEQLPGLIDECKANAIKAWDYAIKNPNIVYNQPADIATGTYGDDKLADEWYWAACEMWLTTGDDKYIANIKANYKNWGVPSWDLPGTLGTLSLLTDKGLLVKLADLPVEMDFISMVDSLLNNETQSAYNVSITKFNWGSNSDVANHGIMKLFAYELTGNRKYLHSAINDADYILGRNATGYCFVTGFGHKQVMNLHHRPTGADGIDEPIPGFLAGGPNLATFDDCGKDTGRSLFPAKSYEDLQCSYSTNEMAINWNAPLAYLMNGLTAVAK
jgi:endoglucanase